MVSQQLINRFLRRKTRKLVLRLMPLMTPLLLAPAALPLSSSAALSPVRQAYTVPATVKAKLKAEQFQEGMQDLYGQMGLEQAGLRYEVFNRAMIGYLNLKQQHQLSEQKHLLTVVDYEKPSSEKRLWVVDLQQKKVLYHTYVSHGKNSGNEYARQFSNRNESNMSCVGFLVTGDTYEGVHGLSLKLNGMDPGFNDNALSRNIVVHGAEYANENVVQQHGRLGRSQGCPALPTNVHADVISAIKDGTLLYLHYPLGEFDSAYLNPAAAIEYFTATHQLV